jgi:peptide/nickel transport system permease protein
MNNSSQAPLALSDWRSTREHAPRSGATLGGATVLALVTLAALAAPWLAPHNPLLQDIGNRLAPPGAAHLLGTDGLGRDLLSRLLYGARTTLGLTGLVALLMVPIGLSIGIASGYFGGWTDRILSGVTNVVMAFPPLVLALAFVGLLGPGLVHAALALVLTGWPAYARLARAEAQLLRGSDYIAAAETQGIVGLRLLWGHVLPACMPATRVRLALDLASIILSASALGFLGLGVRPPTPEWGMMVAEGSSVAFEQWWVAAFPGALILLVSLACNTLADGLRDDEARRRA